MSRGDSTLSSLPSGSVRTTQADVGLTDVRFSCADGAQALDLGGVIVVGGGCDVEVDAQPALLGLAHPVQVEVGAAGCDVTEPDALVVLAERGPSRRGGPERRDALGVGAVEHDGRHRTDAGERRRRVLADRAQMAHNAELVALGIGHHHPRDGALADVQPPGAQLLQPSDQRGLLFDRYGRQVEVDAVLRRLQRRARVRGSAVAGPAALNHPRAARPRPRQPPPARSATPARRTRTGPGGPGWRHPSRPARDGRASAHRPRSEPDGQAGCRAPQVRRRAMTSVRLDLQVDSKVYARAVSTYTIGETASRSGFSASALRYYEDIGLVAPRAGRQRLPLIRRPRRDRLPFVARARQLGCTLDEIVDLVGVGRGALRPRPEALPRFGDRQALGCRAADRRADGSDRPAPPRRRPALGSTDRRTVRRGLRGASCSPERPLRVRDDDDEGRPVKQRTSGPAVVGIGAAACAACCAGPVSPSSVRSLRPGSSAPCWIGVSGLAVVTVEIVAYIVVARLRHGRATPAVSPVAVAAPLGRPVRRGDGRFRA